MEIPVLVEPQDLGFRACTQSPLPLSADGATEDAAVEALTSLIKGRLAAGGRLRTIQIPDLEAIGKLGDAIVSNPFYADWLEGLEEYRKIHNAVPEVD